MRCHCSHSICGGEVLKDAKIIRGKASAKTHVLQIKELEKKGGYKMTFKRSIIIVYPRTIFPTVCLKTVSPPPKGESKGVEVRRERTRPNPRKYGHWSSI